MSRIDDQHGPLVDLGTRAPAGAGAGAQPVADRAARLDRRPRAGRGRRHHDVPGLDHDRHGAAGERLGGGVAVGSRQRNHHPGAPGGRARSRPRRGGGGRRRCAPSPASSRSGPSARRNPPNCWNRGSAADLSLDDLPVPRVIVARVQPGTALDLAALRRPGDAGGADGQRRRSPRLDRADAVDDRRDRARRHRHPGAGDRRDHHFGFVRDPRRDGGQSADRRGAALRRRRRPLHRQPLPAAFSAARAARAA